MLVDFSAILNEYAEGKDYFFILDYPSGANQRFDNYLISDKDTALWENIIEQGVLSRSNDGRTTTYERTIEVVIAVRSKTKDDNGYNYAPLLMDVQQKALDLYMYLIMKTDTIQGATIQTGIDQNDATLVIARLTLTVDNNLQICSTL